jgi:hypothetical protein
VHLLRHKVCVFLLVCLILLADIACVYAETTQYEGFRQYVGTINGILSIHMALKQEDGRINGWYYYDAQGIELLLYGEVSGNSFSLQEYDQDRKNTGLFRGEFSDNGIVKGYWLSPDGKVQYPFQVKVLPSLGIVTNPANTTVAANEQKFAIEAYRKVLQNKVAFSSAFYQSPDKKEKAYLHEFLEHGRGPGYSITRFTVFDMDGDKIPEVVLELKIGDNGAEFREVMHYYNGEVYGYLFGIRALNGLKTDGTFRASNGASSTSYNKLRFLLDTYEFDKLGYSEPSSNEYGFTVSYFMNNKPVTSESFHSFMNEHDRKEDVAWYEFSQENIETILRRQGP